MTDSIVVQDISEDIDGECAHCMSESCDSWIESKNGEFYCTDCAFGSFIVEYDRYVEYTLMSRRKSLEIASSSQCPSELIGQCHRNSASTMKVLYNKSKIPKDNIFLCIGYYNDSGLNDKIGHYWVAVGDERNLLHIDSVMPSKNSGILIDDELPEGYQLERTVSYSQKRKMPNEVKKWL